MKKTGIILAAVSALAFGSLVLAQPARADGGATIAVIAVGGWGWCHLTYGQPRMTPLCAWHDHWHATWHAQHAPVAAPKKK
jgi:hypothetical protein